MNASSHIELLSVPWTLPSVSFSDAMSVVGFLCLGLFLMGCSFYVLWVYRELYEKRIISGKRLPRTDSNSPSSYKLSPPQLRNWRVNQQRILGRMKLYPSRFTTFSNITDVKEVDHDREIHNTKRTRSTKKSSAVPSLDMDHIYVNFFQLLWAFTFVAPFTVILWRKNVAWLRIRIFLVKLGVLKKKSVDLEVLAGKLVLEQSQVIHYFAQSKKSSKLGKIACFSFSGEYTTLVVVVFDLKQKKDFKRCLLTHPTIIVFKTSRMSITRAKCALQTYLVLRLI